MMQEDDSAGVSSSDDKVISQLSDALDTQVTLSAASPVPSVSGSSSPSPLLIPGLVPQGISSTPPPAPVNPLLLSSAAPTPLTFSTTGPPQTSLLGGPPSSSFSGMAPPMGAPLSMYQPPPTSSYGGLTTSAPPPKTGFQPVPHSLHNYESHHSPPPMQNASAPPLVPPQMPLQTGVNIFTPSYDPNAPPSPYAAQMPPTGMSMQHSAPPAQGGMHDAGPPHESSIQLGMPMESYQGGFDNQASTAGGGPDLSTVIDWIKTNETVNKMMQQAKTGVEKVITAMDPQMRDVLYSGGDINVVVASSKPVKVDSVKHSFQTVFGRATVNGMDAQPGVAPQPVGYSAGIRGAEERISNLRRSGQVNDRQVCVAVESFIVELLPNTWYDVSCLMLNDPVNNISIQTFSQATPVNIEYVQQAQNETPKDYHLSDTGLAITVGHVMHRQCAVDPSNWHYYFTGISRGETLLLASKQLAYIYKQRLPRNY